MSADEHDEDVKRWLGSALSDEPPLRLDRDEVFRQGRRRLRNRKLFQAGGAASGVVAVVAGAVLFSGWATEEEPTIPPAASSTRQSPSSSAQSHPVEVPTTTKGPPPSTSTSVDGEITKESSRLTAALTRPGVLPGPLVPSAGEQRAPAFRELHEGVYRLEADVHTGTGAGWLSVLVEHAGDGMGATCAIPEVSFEHCEVRTEFGLRMTVGVRKLEDGEVRLWVRSVRPGEGFVTAISSNLPGGDRSEGEPEVHGEYPAVSEAELIRIAALPEFAPR